MFLVRYFVVCMVITWVKRKAWDLNPHDREVARFSKPARQAVSGCLPFSKVDPRGIEPRFPPRQGSVVPLDHEPVFNSFVFKFIRIQIR